MSHKELPHRFKPVDFDKQNQDVIKTRVAFDNIRDAYFNTSPEPRYIEGVILCIASGYRIVIVIVIVIRASDFMFLAFFILLMFVKFR